MIDREPIYKEACSTEVTQDFFNGIRGVNQEVFAEAYETLVPGLKRFATRIVGEIWAEDITQEAMLNLWLRGKQDFNLNVCASWTRKSVRNGGIDFLRRAVNRPAARFDQDDGDSEETTTIASLLEDPNSPDPEKVAISNEANSSALKLLTSLGELDSKVVFLKCFEGDSHKEIASQLKITEQASRLRYMRALKKLRDQMYEDSPKSP